MAGISLTIPTPVPPIPDIRADNVLEVLRNIKNLLDVREGFAAADPLDQRVTFRDLYGLGKLDRSAITGEYYARLPNSGLAFLPAAPGVTEEFNPPPAPTGLTVTGALANFILEWDEAQYHGHAYTEVWRAGTNDIGLAVMVGTEEGSVYADNLGLTGATRYFWTRHVSKAGVPGPFNATAGTSGTTGSVAAGDIIDGSITTVKLADGSVVTAKLGDAAVTTTKTADSAITTAKLNDLSVTTTKIGASAVTAVKIGDSEVTTTKITDSAVIAQKIAAAAVVAGKIATNAIVAGDGVIATAAIGTALIQDAAITTAKVGDLAVDSAKIASLAVGTAKIADLAVTTIKMDNLSVTTGKIVDLAVTTAKIALLAVTTALIADAAITTAKIGSAQITTALISDAAITTAKIGDAEITNAKIANATIQGGKIAAATITADKMSVTSLSAITANMGSITAGNITLDTAGYIRGGQTGYDTGTGFFLGYSSGAYRFSLGSSTRGILWDGSAFTVRGDLIATGNIQADAITNTLTAYNTGSTSVSTSWTDLASVTITTTGGKVVLQAACRAWGTINNWNIRILRGTSNVIYITEHFDGFTTYYLSQALASCSVVDTPAAGTYTYKLQAQTGSGTNDVARRFLSATELKR